jgi:hypothetical protein
MSGQPETVAVYVTNATRTSAGPGPGPKQLPPAEARALVERKLAVYGSQPPAGFGALW